MYNDNDNWDNYDNFLPTTATAVCGVGTACKLS
jgi:hypothetical protein